MGGASIETTLELWASSLRDVKARMRPLFTQERVAASAGLFLDGLLGDEPRKTGWMRAEAAGDPGPWRQQAILGRGRWDADALRDIVRDYALETLADEDAVLVIDETGFLKQGKASCGVARQYTGSAGKITNCQIGVFASYVSRHGHAFIDRALYLPKAWTDDPARMEAAHVPDDDRLCDQAALAVADDRAGDCGKGAVRLGCGRQRLWRRRDRDGAAARRQGLCAGRRRATIVFRSWGKQPPIAGTAAEIAQRLDPSRWQRLSAGEGTKGARLHDWAYLELADLDAGRIRRRSAPGLWTRGLLIRRNIADGDLAFFSTWCPAGTRIEKLVTVEGHRWAIEDSFETAKNELGLDHNETRSWHGWHRHVSLVMLAFAMMAAIRHHANATPPPKTNCQDDVERPQAVVLIRWSIQEIRRIAIKLAQRRIQPAHVIAWSLWRRAHQASAAKLTSTKNATVMLGHQLISAHPDACGGELDEGEVVGVVLFVAGGDGAEVLELVEEALDEVAVAVEEGAEGGDVHCGSASA